VKAKLEKRYQHTEAAIDWNKSWYDMRSDTEDYVKRCDACQRVNPKMPTEKPALHCVTVPKAAFQQWLPLKSCQLGEESLAEASIYLKNQDDVHFIVVTSLDKKKV